MPRQALVYSKQNLLMPPGHPIILLKSKLFSLAAVSVKRSIPRCDLKSLMERGEGLNERTVSLRFVSVLSTVTIYTARMRVMLKCPMTSLKLFPSMCLWI